MVYIIKQIENGSTTEIIYADTNLDEAKNFYNERLKQLKDKNKNIKLELREFGNLVCNRKWKTLMENYI